MKEVDSSKIVPFEEASRPNEPYVFEDKYGNQVEIHEMVPEFHTPHDYCLLNEPAVFQNLGFATRTAIASRPGKSDDNSEVVFYRKDGLFDEIDHPGKANYKNTQVIIGVKYRGTGKNEVVTYYDKPKGVVW